jgi:flagellar hook-associated protein 1 FlgK
MVNLLATLGVAADALDAYSQSLQVTENNVVNASTPGYAAQTQTLQALMFNPSEGDAGGVAAGQIESSRNEYAEQAVRQQNVLLGAASQDVTSLTSLQTIFDVSGDTGIPYALNNLLQSFSTWAQSPTDSTAQQSVIDNATDMASAFNDAAASLDTTAQDANQQIQTTVTQVNQLVGQLQQYNVQEMAGDRDDPGLDAQVHSTLQELSQYVDVTATQTNGAWSVLLDGQTPLLIGTQQYQISSALEEPADPPPTNVNGPPQEVVRTADGTDITSSVTTGQLGALLNFRNTVLASYMGSGSRQGELNIMAQQFADRVNSQLTSGNVSDGPPAVAGSALFTYDTANATNVAQSLTVNPAITAGQLAAIDPGPPEVSNGAPLALAQLANPQSSGDEIDGLSYSEYYGNMASGVGSLLSEATNEQSVQQSAVAQAENLRQQISGVDLDEEAITLTQFQQGYDAVSKMVNILDQITEDAITMVETTT